MKRINYPSRRRQRSLADRFWPKVDKRGPIHPVLKTRCWLWVGAIASNGYGNISRGRREEGWAKAHQVSWKLHGRKVLKGKQVLHRCDVRNCVRLSHLFTGTPRQNTIDMYAKGRSHWDKMKLIGKQVA